MKNNKPQDKFKAVAEKLRKSTSAFNKMSTKSLKKQDKSYSKKSK